jgi:hypothetical protein
MMSSFRTVEVPSFPRQSYITKSGFAGLDLTKTRELPRGSSSGMGDEFF